MTTHRKDKRTTYKREFSTIDYIHEYDLDIEKRDIFLFGREEYAKEFESAEPGVEYLMANRLIKNLRILQSVTDDPILIHMKTNGGDWTEGMAIYNAIKACPNYVTILNYTHARSMSSLIFQAADWRVMMPDSTFMFHDGTWTFDGTVKQAHTEYAEVEVASERMMQIYLDSAEHGARWAGKTRKQIRRWMRDQMDRKEEVYLPAGDTVEHGFADAVFDYDWGKIRGG